MTDSTVINVCTCDDPWLVAEQVLRMVQRTEPEPVSLAAVMFCVAAIAQVGAIACGVIGWLTNAS